MHNDYVVADYNLLPEDMNEHARGRKTLDTTQVFLELVSQRLAQVCLLLIYCLQAFSGVLCMGDSAWIHSGKSNYLLVNLLHFIFVLICSSRSCPACLKDKCREVIAEVKHYVFIEERGKGLTCKLVYLEKIEDTQY